jgi:erythronate-4-phosphate dehydrogenase
MALRILVDEAVPLAEAAFARFGEVRRAPGRAIDGAAVAWADALVVRSVTRVDEALLAGSPVRFVGTATIGIDHVDVDFLDRRGIAFASAPGCNARSVAEWVIAALLEVEAERGLFWEGRTLGVVGVGHVGSLVARLAPALGLRVLCCDPPRAQAEGVTGFVPFEQLLDAADAITLHVPLVRGGPHPTHHLVGSAELARFVERAMLLNSSRGPVVDGPALLRALASETPPLAVLDVWEGEPEPDPALVERVAFGTPHVAGYSLDGKVEGTRMIARALAHFLGESFEESTVALEEGPTDLRVGGSGRAAIRAAVAAAVPLRRDDAALRAACAGPAVGRGQAFDALRRNYPKRREFGSFRIPGAGIGPAERQVLEDLGFARPGT